MTGTRIGLLGAGLVAGLVLIWFLLPSDSDEPAVETFEVRWWVSSYDPDLLAAQLGGGHPELADRLVEVLTWDPSGGHDREALGWLGERVANRGAGYDGLNDAEYLLMDEFMRAVPQPEGLGEEIDTQPCGVLADSLLQQLAADLDGPPSSALDALREGRRIGGGDPVLPHAYAILTPAETLALVTELEGPWSASSDPAREDAEVLTCLRAAADAGRGTYYANED